MTTERGSSLRALSPSYFALVMATGIVSICFADVGYLWAARGLLAIAIVAYLVLAVLYVLRWVRHADLVGRDSRNPSLAFGYFTIVAGTSVVAVGMVRESLTVAAIILVFAAAIMWLILGYVLPWRVIMSREDGSILPKVNGTWFVWSVASQSAAVGLSAIHPYVPRGELLIGFLALLTWSVGALLYAGVAVLVILRIVHRGLTPAEFEPPYWVAMGALAISVVAGSEIVDMASTPIVDAARGLVGGTIVIFWCCAAWILPMLAAAGFWRHVLHRVPLTYTPALWSIVFPLGMFAHASIRLGRVEHITVIEHVGIGFLWIAAGAWALVAVGQAVHYARAARRRTRQG